MTYCFHCATEGHEPADCWVAYTPPAAQRQWVGLTELEMAEFVKTMERGNFLVAIYDIEKKLKDKNENRMG